MSDKSRKRYDRKSAAAYIGRCVSTLDKWRYERVVLPYHQDGRIIWYEEEDLDAYLEPCRVEPVAYGCGDKENDEADWAA